MRQSLPRPVHEDDYGSYLPTQEEIAFECVKIRKKNSLAKLDSDKKQVRTLQSRPIQRSYVSRQMRGVTLFVPEG